MKRSLKYGLIAVGVLFVFFIYAMIITSICDIKFDNSGDKCSDNFNLLLLPASILLIPVMGVAIAFPDNEIFALCLTGVFLIFIFFLIGAGIGKIIDRIKDKSIK